MSVIYGTNLNDTLTGGEEKDIIFGKNGKDTISGKGGDDAIFGEAGNDTLTGDDGNDFLDGGDGSDIIDGGNGNNLVLGRNGNDSLSVGFDSENRGATSFIFGGNGDDSLRSGYGNDTLYGEDGNDTLFGFFGNDTLNGGAGNDRIEGSFWSSEMNEIDRLTGGAGADTFVLESKVPGAGSPNYRGDNSNYALITDFNKSEDTIELAKLEGDFRHSLYVEVKYSLGAAPEGLPQGTGIYVDNPSRYIGNQGDKPDLIAILQGVDPSSLSLSDSYFKFV